MYRVLSTRELIAKAGPRIVARRSLSIINALLWASAAFCLVPIMMGGLVVVEPSLRDSLAPAALLSYVIGIGLFAAWSVLNAVTLMVLLWRSNALLADQLDAQVSSDDAQIALLAASFTPLELESLRRRLEFEVKINERFSGTVAIVGALGAAITTTVAALPASPWRLEEALKVAIPALLLGAAIAGALRHSFGLRLLRLGFMIAEAERLHAQPQAPSRQ